MCGNAFARVNRIDQDIFEAEKELEEGGVSIDLDEAFDRLDGKYYGFESEVS